MHEIEKEVFIETTQINTKIEFCKDDLINSLESIIRTCQYELNRLKKEEDYIPNSLGIIQKNTIDIQCARLGTLAEIKRSLNE